MRRPRDDILLHSILRNLSHEDVTIVRKASKWRSFTQLCRSVQAGIGRSSLQCLHTHPYPRESACIDQYQSMVTERAEEIRSLPGIIRRRLGVLAAIGLDRDMWVICNINRESPFAVDACPALEVEDPGNTKRKRTPRELSGFCVFPSLVDMHDSRGVSEQAEDEVTRENFPSARAKVCSELSEEMGIE